MHDKKLAENPIFDDAWCMKNNTPFLTGFSTLLCGRAKRKRQEQLRMEHERLVSELPGGLSHQLSEEISAKLLRSLSSSKRDREYPDEVVFWGFLSQVMSQDASCSAAVARVQAWRQAQKRKPASANTSCYVRARERLPETMLQEVHSHLCEQLEQASCAHSRWRGLRVKAIDGTSAQAPDTAANRSVYPQPSGQAVGCGFPVVQLVGLIDLGHGGVSDFAQSDTFTGELRGYDQLEGSLEQGDLLVADRLYSSYEVIARLMARGVEFIGRNHQVRKVDFRRGIKCGANQRIQQWRKPRQQSPLSRLSAEKWAALPDEISVRIIRSRGYDRTGNKITRYVVTTLLDCDEYPIEEVSALYHHRWEIEVRFRDIKTTMGMELLRTKSPTMLRKEILMYLIAYNLVRLIMLKAAHRYAVSHRHISFKGVLQVILESSAAFLGTINRPRKWAQAREHLLERIAERLVPYRPGRNEPRKKKRRPKSYGWLQRPRHHYFESYINAIPQPQILR